MAFFEKRMKIRWMLVFYDFIIFMFSVGVFLVYYRGGGILKPVGMIEHLIISFICIFGCRLLWKIYTQIWRYGGVQGYLKLIASDIMGAILYEMCNLFLPIHTISTSRVISITAIQLLGCLIIRMVYRYAFKCPNPNTLLGSFLNILLLVFAGKKIASQRDIKKTKKNIAIIGAGSVGVSLATELTNNNKSEYVPVCFIEINENKINREIRGLPVLDQKKVNVEYLNKYDVDEIVFAVASLDFEKRLKIYGYFREMGYPIKIYDFPLLRTANGKRQVRNFEIEEVLFRPPIEVIDEETTLYYQDKVILVTGGGGSIGSELARQVAAMGPKKLILLDVYENGVYEVQQELRRKYHANLDVSIEIMSITNKRAMAKVFEQYKPQIVIHAAAHKHVPLMEHNCVEAICNNVFGTKNVVELCEEYGVERFMALSTDKAVNPTNVMGATKRMCEFIMQAYSTKGNVKYSATRFGNVLGSAGSVIPLFRYQIAKGGPVTITDKRIIRYFMTIPEASQLVLASGRMAKNGELFVLDMGEPVKIVELAENMIRLSGYTPYEDIDIVEIGLRPGEKLYEELLVDSEDLLKTDNNLIFIEKEEPLSMDELEEKIQVLKDACSSFDNEYAKQTLKSVVPTFYDPDVVNKVVK